MSSLPLNQVFEDTLARYIEPALLPEWRAELQLAYPIQYDSPTKTFVGIEYEIENFRSRRPKGGTGMTPVGQVAFNTLWNAVDDGSLRNNGKELVTKPISGVNIPAALSSLASLIEQEYFQADPSIRCGIHVHVNALDLTVSQLFAWISLYRVFERQLYKFSGGRDKNLFCLPTWAYDGHIMAALPHLKKNPGGATTVLSNNGYKYSGLNVKSLRDKGTLEFRQMHTIRDYNQIALWVEYLTRLKGAGGATTGDYDGLMKYLETLASLNTTSAYSDLLYGVFGERGKFLQEEGWEKDMAQGVILVKEQLAVLRKFEKTRPSVYSFQDEEIPAARHGGVEGIGAMIARAQARVVQDRNPPPPPPREAIVRRNPGVRGGIADMGNRINQFVIAA